MKIFRLNLFFTLLTASFLFGACAANEANNVNSAANAGKKTNSKSAIIAQDNLEELGKIIQFPIAPEEATYAEFNAEGKNVNSNAAADEKKKLVAVLKFSADAARQLTAAAEKYHAPAPLDLEAESWFPPELIAKSQETGDESLKGASYSAKDFLQPPYVNGKLTRIIETDFFVLELTSY